MKTDKNARIILYLTTLFFWFSQSSYLPYISPSLAALGASATMMGLVGGAYGFTQMVCRIPLGYLADRYSLHRKAIVAGTVLSCASGLGIFITFTPAGFLIFRATAGLASATWICFSVSYSKLYPKEQSASAMSVIMSASHIGKLTGLILVGSLAGRTQNVFLIAAAGGVTAVLLSAFIKRPPESPPSFTAKELWGVAKNKTLLKFSCAALLLHFITFSTTYQFTPIILLGFGADDFTLAAANIVTLIFLVLSTISAGKFLIKKFGEKRLLLFGFGCLAVYAFGAGFAKNIAQMYVLQAVAGLGEGFGAPILTGLCFKDITPEKRSAAMGIFAAVYGFGMTFGPIFTGRAVDIKGMTAAYCMIGAVAAAAFIWISRFKVARAAD